MNVVYRLSEPVGNANTLTGKVVAVLLALFAVPFSESEAKKKDEGYLLSRPWTPRILPLVLE